MLCFRQAPRPTEYWSFLVEMAPMAQEPTWRKGRQCPPIYKAAVEQEELEQEDVHSNPKRLRENTDVDDTMANGPAIKQQTFETSINRHEAMDDTRVDWRNYSAEDNKKECKEESRHSESSNMKASAH